MTSDILEWLQARPLWIRAALNILLEKGEIRDEDINSLALLCEQEANAEIEDHQTEVSKHALLQPGTQAVRLEAIDNIRAINALAPRRALEFSSPKTAANLTTVYGHNGAGKSGYVRILKHLCGAKHQGQLHANVFKSDAESLVSPYCEVRYTVDGAAQDVKWTESDGVIPALSSIDVFDSSCGKAYLRSSEKISHEPRLLQMFTALTELGDQLAAAFDQKIADDAWEPEEMGLTDSGAAIGKWYNTLNYASDEEPLHKLASLDLDALRRSAALQSKAAGKNIVNLIARLAGASARDRMQQELTKIQQQFSAANFNKIAELVRCFNASKEALNTAALLMRLGTYKSDQNTVADAEAAPPEPALEHLGSDAWRNLWLAARNFSQTEMYPAADFPHAAPGSRCVLCRQELSNAAAQRMRDFDEFMHSAARKAAEQAENKLEEHLAGFSLVLDSSERELLKLLANIDDGNLRRAITLELGDFLESLRALTALIRARDFERSTVEAQSQAAANIRAYIKTLRNSIEAYEQTMQASGVGEAEAEDERLLQKLGEIDAQIWVHARRETIIQGLKSLRRQERYRKARKLCRTGELSRKKGELFDALVQAKFVERFNEELSFLRADHIRVEMARKGVKKGRVAWQMQLRNAQSGVALDEVLSEGEQRMVELAAFLADVRGRDDRSTFVFDDPISSLDTSFEAAVVDRLLMLARERQVIVFTHRISLLSLINEFAGKYPELELHEVAIRREAWGAGEPGVIPLATRGTKRLFGPIFSLIDEAEKLWKAEGFEAFRPHAQYICTQIRILIERLVEFDLLADVVQRHRRAIVTKDKLLHLTVIEARDCELIERLMSRYSTFVHAQSYELPTELPTPEQLRTDLKTLKEWRGALEKRRR